VIAGGGEPSNPNRVDFGAEYSVISGGLGNHVGANLSAPVIAGGDGNTANGSGAAIGGGSSNRAAGWAVVAGGSGNHADGDSSVVIGGSNNLTEGDSAVVLGGFNNQALRELSLAAGANAVSDHPGAMVFAAGFDSATFRSQAPSEFAVRATGGVRFVTAGNGTGCSMRANNPTWSCTSDRAAKKDLEAIDGDAVLLAIARMPVWRWSYLNQSDGVRHMGPTAQDFRAAFGLGVGDKMIDMVDADGVNLAAVQALEKRTAKLQDENASLRSELENMGAAQRQMLQRLDEMAKRQRH